MDQYKVTLSDVHSFELFSSKRAAFKYARACKDDHGGAAVYTLREPGQSHASGDCLAAWSRGEDGRVRRVNVG